MPELRRDLIHDTWVLIATEQALEPKYFPINRNGTYVPKTKICPFCDGNESLTPPEIAAFRHDNSGPDSSGWIIRTVPSKFSAFKLQGEFAIEEKGLFSHCSGLGKQEVVIGNSNHSIDFHQFSADRIGLVYRMFQQRYQALSADSRIKYIQIYKNRGLFAGASQEHSHSQIVALPMVPKHKRNIIGYYQEKGRCLICTLMEQERQTGERIVCESDKFLVLCPYASRFSYETWIIPKRHCEHFAGISEEEIKDLSMTIKRLLNVMLDSLNDPAYNIVINTSPVNVPYKEGNHWFMEINPRFIVSNGFEISSGYYTNPVAPEISAAILRKSLTEFKPSM
ncbi:MAG: DUF4931 domain-containing protein [Syntrophomonas sp.]